MISLKFDVAFLAVGYWPTVAILPRSEVSLGQDLDETLLMGSSIPYADHFRFSRSVVD